MFKNSISRIAIILAISFLLFSCGKTTSNTTFKFANISFLSGATVGSDFNGGVLVFGKNTKTGESFQLALDPNAPADVAIDLSFGPYEFKAIGWNGSATILGGTPYCGQTVTLIDQPDSPVEINMSNSACSDPLAFSNTTIYNNTNPFIIQTCHGIVKVAGKGEVESCGDAPSIARSIRIKYNTINQDGTTDPTQSLLSGCIDSSTDYFNYDVTGNINLVRGINGFNTPFDVIAYRGTGCTDSSLSRTIPRNNVIPTLNNLLFRPTPSASYLFVGMDSCAFPGALDTTNSPYAEIEDGVTLTLKSTNTICTKEQFDNIAANLSLAYLIARPIDFVNTAPSTGTLDFTGSLIGDFQMFFNGNYHFKGASDKLFNSIKNTAGKSELRNLNIFASTTQGPLIANNVSGNISIEEMTVAGSVMNTTSPLKNLITENYANCGGLFNYYESDLANNYDIDVNDISFNNFTMDCGGEPQAPLAIGALFGSIITAETKETKVDLSRINGNINLKNTIGSLTKSLGGLIGTSSQNNRIDIHGSDLDVNTNNTKAVMLGGLIGELKNKQNFEYGKVNINNSSVNLTANESLAINTLQGIGGMIGRAYNPTELRIFNSTTTGSIVSQHKNAGGFIGYVGNIEYGGAEISNSFNNIDITAGQHAGGFIGSLDSNQTSAYTGVKITSSINNGYIKSLGKYDIDTTTTAGGFIGCAGCGSAQVRQIDIQNSSNKEITKAFKFAPATQNFAGSIIGVVDFGAYTPPQMNFSNVYAHKPSYENYSDTDNTLFYDNTKFISKTVATYPISYSLTSLGCPTCDDIYNDFFTGDGTQDNYFSVLSATIADPANDEYYSVENGLLKIENFYNYFFKEGSAHGTETRPFLLATKQDAMYLNNKGAEFFSWKVMNDIPMAGARFQMGEDFSNFEGVFDGNGKTISDFRTSFEGTTAGEVGVFPKITNGRIHNLTLKGGKVIADTETGGGPCGILAGLYDAASANGDNHRAQIFNVHLIDNTLEAIGNGCANYSPLFGSLNININTDDGTAGGNPIVRFSNIKIRGNDLTALTAGNVGGITGRLAGTTAGLLPLKNIEISRNSFAYANANSSAFIASSQYTSNTILLDNTLFVDQSTDSSMSPQFGHLALASIGSYSIPYAGAQNYFFIHDGQTYGSGELNGSAYLNTSNYKLADAVTYDFSHTLGVFYNNSTYGPGLNFPLLNYQADQ